MTYFATMTDNFMSGWGGAEGRISKYVVECDTKEQADHIHSVARDERDEMNRVVAKSERPIYDAKTYQVSRKHWDDLGGMWKDGWQG